MSTCYVAGCARKYAFLYTSILTIALRVVVSVTAPAFRCQDQSREKCSECQDHLTEWQTWDSNPGLLTTQSQL